MREHRYSLDMPHSPARIWALMQDYPRWTAYAPMVLEVQVLHPGDSEGNGLLRRVIYRLPFGRRGAALELVTGVKPARGYRYTMIAREPGNDQIGRVELEPLGPNRTRLHFEERYELRRLPWRLFEGPIYRFINRKNEESMQRLSDWLGTHPEYRPDLMDSKDPTTPDAAGPSAPSV
ncbi:MAG: SRPBCC family protein [Myxococcota bacterium]